MCTLTHFLPPAGSRTQIPLGPHFAALQSPLPLEHDIQPPLFQVVPAGNAFFHIKESSTGRVRGFRGDHNEACALARSLERQIELLASDRLR